MARPKNADGQRTRQAILDAALELFAEKGYFGTTLRDVASAVGVRESALYNYFASKDALFDALIADHQQAKTERYAKIAEAPISDGHAVLEQLAMTMIESFVTPRHRQLFRILMSDGIRLSKVGRINLAERMGDRRDQLHDLLRRLMHEGWLRESDPMMLGLIFMSPLILWRHLDAIDANLPMVKNPRAFVRAHVDQFLRGAAAESGRLAVHAPRKPTSTRRPARRRTTAASR